MIASRMRDIEPFHVMDILARAKQLESEGKSIIHMEIGEPDFHTPQPIIEAAHQALNRGDTFYTAAAGLPELRDAISGYYQERFGLDIPASRIVVTPGASGALLLALGVLVNPGEQMLITDPGYPCNRHFIRTFDAEPVGIPVDANINYQPTVELIEKYWTTQSRGALLASPSNPTGTLMPKQVLAQIAQYIEGAGGKLIVDEIYQGLIYEETPSSSLEISDQFFVINSFSKYFNMTGWRLGWMVAPEKYVREIEKLSQNIFLAASTPAQHAALAAFKPETISILEQRKKIFQERRDYLLSALGSLGFEIAAIPKGAFYIYAKCPASIVNSYDFVIKLLEEGGVALAPGLDFGKYQSKQYVRFAYTTALENLQEGIKRLKAFL